MVSANDVSATEVMNTDHVTVNTDHSISQIKNRMEENNLRSIPVVNNGKLKGVVGYRDLIRHVQFNPANTKVDEVMHQPPEFEADDSLIELASLRINSGRKMLANTEDGKLKGIIGDQEFLDALQDLDEFSDLTTMDIGSLEVLEVFEQDTLEKARHMMLDNNISRLPVLDKNGNLTGIIRSTDMLRMLVPRESQTGSSTKDTGNAREAAGNEKEKMSDITVTELMNRIPSTVEGHIDADEAVDRMLENDTDDLIIVDREYPEAIVTVKDYLKRLEKLSARDTVLVQLIGLEVEEEKAAVHDKIATQMQGSLGRKLEKPEEISLHIKKADKDGEKHRYEIVGKLYSELGTITVQEESWELLDAVDSILDEMNTLVRKKKDKRQDYR
jgi:CBS domain-containing protein